MVQRYDLVSADRRDIEESPDGYFVEYEDYAALELRVLAALSHLERATEAENRVLCSGYAKMALRMPEDQHEQDELLDEWYRTEECPYDK